MNLSAYGANAQDISNMLQAALSTQLQAPNPLYGIDPVKSAEGESDDFKRQSSFYSWLNTIFVVHGDIQVEDIMCQLANVIEQADLSETAPDRSLYGLSQNSQLSALIERLPEELALSLRNRLTESQQGSYDLLEAIRNEDGELPLIFRELLGLLSPENANKMLSVLAQLYPADAQGIHRPGLSSGVLWEVLHQGFLLHVRGEDAGHYFEAISSVLATNEPAYLTRFLNLIACCGNEVPPVTSVEEVYDFWQKLQIASDPQMIETHLWAAVSFTNSGMSFDDYLLVAENLGAFAPEGNGLAHLMNMRSALRAVRTKGVHFDVLSSLMSEAREGYRVADFIAAYQDQQGLAKLEAPQDYTRIKPMTNAHSEPMVIRQGESAALLANQGFNTYWSSLSEGELQHEGLYFDLSGLAPGVHHILVRNVVTSKAVTFPVASMFPALQTVVVLPAENGETSSLPMPSEPSPYETKPQTNPNLEAKIFALGVRIAARVEEEAMRRNQRPVPEVSPAQHLLRPAFLDPFPEFERNDAVVWGAKSSRQPLDNRLWEAFLERLSTSLSKSRRAETLVSQGPANSVPLATPSQSTALLEMPEALHDSDPSVASIAELLNTDYRRVMTQLLSNNQSYVHQLQEDVQFQQYQKQDLQDAFMRWSAEVMRQL